MVVTNENAPAAAPLVVKGYDVSGEVQSDSEPMKASASSFTLPV